MGLGSICISSHISNQLASTTRRYGTGYIYCVTPKRVFFSQLIFHIVQTEALGKRPLSELAYICVKGREGGREGGSLLEGISGASVNLLPWFGL